MGYRCSIVTGAVIGLDYQRFSRYENQIVFLFLFFKVIDENQIVKAGT